MTLRPEENDLLASLGFDRKVGQLLRASCASRIERLHKFNTSGDLVPVEGLSLPVKDGTEAESIMIRIQPELIQHGYRAFWSKRLDERGGRRGDEIAILNTVDKYAFVVMCRADGANYGISNENVLDRLKSWERFCAFDVVGASHDWVALQFERLPENICRFAEEVYQFCPDSVEQGVGLQRESDHPERFAAACRLCPEVSVPSLPREEDYLEKLKSKLPPEELESVKQQLQMLSALKRDSTSTDMGVRLLAEEISRTRYLFLWWD